MNNNSERTFENLTRRIKGRTFITCESREIYDRLLADAKEAGFEVPEAFYDYWDIVSINMDGRSLASGGTFFHMQFYGSADVYRVDYGKYIRGEADFIYHGERKATPEKYEHAYIKSKFFGKVAVSGKNNKKAKEYYLGNNGYLDEPDDEQFLFTQIERMFRVLIITDDKFDLTRAHRFSCNHKPELEKDSVCGCFYCMKIFKPSEIEDWLFADNACDRRGTAICPYCGIDSVIGESSGFPITEEFMKIMYDRWFGD